MERGNALGIVLNRSRRGNASDRVAGRGLRLPHPLADGSDRAGARGHPRPVVLDIVDSNLLD